ncbi:MAG: glycosyltransferase [Planctomycetaceae bacterium]|nr:glycosyltransferase [Planctomycetaceae bacterium]
MTLLTLRDTSWPQGSMGLPNTTQNDHISAGLPDGSPLLVAPADHDLTVVVPAFNEERRLPWTLSHLASFLDDWGVDYRVLVADDGSDDRTAGMTRGLGPRFSSLRISPHGGKGRAVRTAMLRGTGRVLAFTDADLPFRLEALRRGYDWIRHGQCRVVFGARDVAGAENLAPRRLSRRVATFAFRQIVSRLVSREVTDTQCGLKLFERRAALEIFGRATIDGFAFDAEVVLLTHRLDLPFARVPVTLVNEFTSTLSLRRNALPMLWDVLRLRLHERARQAIPDPHFVFAAETEAPRRKAAA